MKRSDILKHCADFPEMLLNILESNELIESAQLINYEKKSKIIKSGERPKYIYILVDGIVRGYIEDENFCKYTDCIIYKSGTILVASPDIDSISTITFQALTGAKVLLLPHSLIKQMLCVDAELAVYIANTLYEYLAKHREIKIIRSKYKVEDRYKWFCEKYCKVKSMISDKVAASFIDTTPQTLSQIKKKHLR